MSDLAKRMAELTGGNTASVEVLRDLFGEANGGYAGDGGTEMRVDITPDLESMPSIA